ncbi:MAG: DASH family cryptochrome [Bacteroidota bacterium]
MERRIIVWINNDLRVRDNQALYKAARKGFQVYPIYVFDPRKFEQSEIGLPRTGSYRAKFLIESVADLKQNLKRLGSDLLIRVGKPEEVLPELAAELKVNWLYTSKEVATEEVEIEEKLEVALAKLGVLTEFFWQSTLHHVQDVPWPIKHLPDVFTEFRKELEQVSTPRDAFPEPNCLEPLNLEEGKLGDLPTLQDFGLSEPVIDERSVLNFKGGETAALNRLQQYIWEQDLLKDYKETRNGLVGANYSSKFSAWLANGSLSPRTIYEEIKKYEQIRVKNRSTYWLYFELLWRDYFKFVTKKYGSKIFHLSGFLGNGIESNQDIESFQKWKEGATLEPFVNANMLELAFTGFMSNRGRQNVASYLVNDLKVDWRWGASYFESLLIDYDVSSNWCNWAYIAGVGNDPRSDRYFNIPSQAKKYDPHGEYVELWLSDQKIRVRR